MPSNDDESRTTDGSTFAARRRRGAAGPGRGRPGRGRLALFYVPVLVVVLAVGAFVAVRGGGDDDGGEESSLGAADREELVRSGPMTPEKAELVGEDPASIDFGPRCDRETGRIMLPTVYAAPCVEAFAGGNGGATSPGVTGDTIELVAYVPNPDADPLREGAIEDTGVEGGSEEQAETIRNYVSLYNRVFETYGRQVEVELFTATGGPADQAAAKADAISIAEREPFAVIGGPTESSAAFADELAARDVICLEGCAVGLDREFLDERAPYVWMTGTSEQSVQTVAEAVGKLAGPGPAEMAGHPEMRERDRVYGVVHYDTPDGFYEEAYEQLRAGLADHGIDVEVDGEYTSDPGRTQETVRTIITRLRDAEVTTVVFAGEPLAPASLTEEATAQGYFPEWVHGGGVLVDSSLFARGYDDQQWVNGFGVSNLTPAAEELETHNQIYQWAFGTLPPNVAQNLEPPLRSLFTGVHLAGPELTPETFRDGLLRYPESGGGPTRPPLDYDYTTGGNAALIWWDPEAEGVAGGEEGEGMYRYAAGGERYTLGDFPDSPEEAGLFDVDSSVIHYDELPPEDRAPTYPPPG